MTRKSVKCPYCQQRAAPMKRTKRSTGPLYECDACDILIRIIKRI